MSASASHTLLDVENVLNSGPTPESNDKSEWQAYLLRLSAVQVSDGVTVHSQGQLTQRETPTLTQELEKRVEKERVTALFVINALDGAEEDEYSAYTSDADSAVSQSPQMPRARLRAGGDLISIAHGAVEVRLRVFERTPEAEAERMEYITGSLLKRRT